MARTYYAMIESGTIISDKSYSVIKFKMEGKVRLTDEELMDTFTDRNGRTEFAGGIICLAATGKTTEEAWPIDFVGGWLITHGEFIDYRSQGIPRVEPEIAIVKWPY